jgi:iron complex transport system substrate-binding protein
MNISTFFILVFVTLSVPLAVIPVVASDYTLDIFGNANMDDTIDEGDIEYVQRIIDGTSEVTELADANYDGEIDEKDITQIELITAGEEDTIVLIDQAGRTITVDKPVERIVTLFPAVMRVVVHLGGVDKIVGVDSRTVNYADNMIVVQAYPEVRELSDVGNYDNPNQELILSLDPDLIISYSSDVADTIENNLGIPVLCINPSPTGNEYNAPGGPFETWRLVGFAIDEENRADELIAYCRNNFYEIDDVTSDIPEDEKPKVYFCHSQGATDITRAVTSYDPIDVAAGINVAKDLVSADKKEGLSTVVLDVSKERIINWNPDIVLIHSFSKDPLNSVEKVLSDPTLQTVGAVKEGHVYYTKGWYIGWDPASGLAETFYLAKLFHPDVFEDLDVEERGNDIFEEFYGADGLYTWMLDSVGNYYRWE